MDDPRHPSDGGALPLQGPHWRHNPSPPTAPDFVPLRLVLQPSGIAVVLSRPDMLLGRHSEADVRLPLPDVSRRHCRFVWAEGAWEVHDLNSLNGVFLNDERVHRAVVRQDDLLRIGGFTFKVELRPDERTVALSPGENEGDEDVLRSIADALPRPEHGSSHQRRLAS
jgi:predicted component of type VI protein secretion system